VFESFASVDWDAACTACQAPRAINRSYFATRDPLKEPGARSARSLERVGALRYGQLWRCRVCGRPWYDPDNGLCTSVERNWIPILERWNAQPHLATNAQVMSLRAIGAVRWASNNSELRVPCRVRRGQSWYDPALAVLQNSPLLRWRNPAPEVFGIHEMEEIAPTEFALPHELRKRGIDAPEKAMGYAPHSAYWGKTQVHLNGLVEFWGVDGRMGMDLTYRSASGNWRPRAQDPRGLDDYPLTYVMADSTYDVARQLRS
jgi:hypothetical protein